MLLEGNRPGRTFVDSAGNPSVALIWAGMEYAYLVEESARHGGALVQVVDEVILPILEEAGSEFVTIFPHGISPAAVQVWFARRRPVSFGVNSFSF
jgi:hypothetical protein